MIEMKNTGGSEFACVANYPSESFGESLIISEGMTLRDYFAASSGVTWEDAVAVATHKGTFERTAVEIVEMLAYLRWKVADAMIAEREK